MWRMMTGAGAAIALGGAAFLMFGRANAEDPVLPPPPTRTEAPATGTEQPPERIPEAAPRTREEKRFDRYDKDRNDRITREEMLATRRKAYEKLDSDGDGKLSFEEWAVKTSDKFANADADRDRILTRAEFATTRIQRKSPRRATCPPAAEEDA